MTSGSDQTPHPHFGFGRGGAGIPLTQPGVPALPPSGTRHVSGQDDAYANELDAKETPACS